MHRNSFTYWRIYLCKIYGANVLNYSRRVLVTERGNKTVGFGDGAAKSRIGRVAAGTAAGRTFGPERVHFLVLHVPFCRIIAHDYHREQCGLRTAATDFIRGRPHQLRKGAVVLFAKTKKKLTHKSLVCTGTHFALFETLQYAIVGDFNAAVVPSSHGPSYEFLLRYPPIFQVSVNILPDR